MLLLKNYLFLEKKILLHFDVCRLAEFFKFINFCFSVNSHSKTNKKIINNWKPRFNFSPIGVLLIWVLKKKNMKKTQNFGGMTYLGMLCTYNHVCFSSKHRQPSKRCEKCIVLKMYFMKHSGKLILYYINL